MANLPAGLTRDQFIRALHGLDPRYAFLFHDDDSFEWRGIAQDGQYMPAPQPDNATVQAAWAAVAAQDQAEADLDTADATAHGNLLALRTQLNDAETQLQNIVSVPAPTAANLAALQAVVAAVKLLAGLQLAQIKLWRYVITRGIRKGWL